MQISEDIIPEGNSSEYTRTKAGSNNVFYYSFKIVHASQHTYLN